jgi:hypothetical protein
MNQIEIGKNNTEFLLVKLQYNILGRGTLWEGHTLDRGTLWVGSRL